VLRRDATTLQVGLGERPVLLPDRPAIGALLRHLDPTVASERTEPDLDDPEVTGALRLLREAGHLVPDQPAARTPRPVGLIAHAPGIAERAAPLLGLAGLVHDDDRAQVCLVLSAGPLPRAESDRLVHDEVPHLLVGSLEGAWRIGPFVVPGLTACLRCVDAHESATDPRRSLLLAQAARAAREHPEPSDPLQEQWALTWAARDLRTYLDGGEPGTWSTTVDLPAPEAQHSAPRTTRWLRHPECGCSWDLLVDLP